MKTEDPIAHPLPSWDLLDMQWMLKRFSRFQGDSKSTYRGWVRRGMKPTDDYDWVHRGSTWNWRRRAWVWDEDDAEMHKDDSEESEESEVSGWMSSEYDTDDDDGDS
ncbi:hypothetical protein N7456_009327 [Penicillium angulare]|uniref:Uncharacterized protein n=1 Tax=Penicillium angulare TaxID=116970 RepID=A0A9W9K5M3_9EURO|nr:hypothetical protein N7456_009327 [Penicillium angulare]